MTSPDTVYLIKWSRGVQLGSADFPCETQGRAETQIRHTHTHTLSWAQQKHDSAASTLYVCLAVHTSNKKPTLLVFALYANTHESSTCTTFSHTRLHTQKNTQRKKITVFCPWMHTSFLYHINRFLAYCFIRWEIRFLFSAEVCRKSNVGHTYTDSEDCHFRNMLFYSSFFF